MENRKNRGLENSDSDRDLSRSPSPNSKRVGSRGGKRTSNKNNINNPSSVHRSNSNSSRGGGSAADRLSTEELDAIADASITERMRLSQHLPNSQFKRYFDKTGKPILSKGKSKSKSKFDL